jgi:hypothetical protein
MTPIGPAHLTPFRLSPPELVVVAAQTGPARSVGALLDRVAG